MINNKTEGISIVHGNSTISPVGSTNNDDNLAGPISYRKSYINYLPFDVTVAERNGMRQVAKRHFDNYKKCFIIRTQLHIRQDGYDDAEKMFSTIDNDSSQDLMQIKEVYYMNCATRSVGTGVNKRPLGGMTIILDNVITLDSFKENNATVYYSNSDVLVSALSLLDSPAHPYSPKAIQTKEFKNIIDDGGSIGFNLELIDNNGKYGIRYVSFAKQIYTITPKRDLVRGDGIYVTTLEKNLTTKAIRVPVQKRYEVDGAEETLGIYKTREECIAGGDIKTLRKEELTRLEHDFSIEKINLERENQELKTKNNKLDQDHKRELLQLEQESKERFAELNKTEQERKEDFAKLKHEIDLKEIKEKQEAAEIERKYKIETDLLNYKNKLLEADLERHRANMKDYYESRSHTRKDTSEWIKFIPAIISGCLAIFAIFMKTKSNA